jgi:lipid-A-disaccharide synthase
MTLSAENQTIQQTSEKKTSIYSCQSPTFAIVVGEHSGDTLGAGLMSSLMNKYPEAKFIGIGGPKMHALGFESLFEMEELAVMGIFEVLGRLKRLFHVKDCLAKEFINNKPNVFIGIDAPDFNLRLELQLKKAGIKTVHYVSPSVWAWREKRIFKIEAATDMVLSLLPFEKDFYDKYEVPCTFVGHPLADDIPLSSDKVTARHTLGLPLDKKILALMPGSRGGELSRLVEPFLLSATELLKQDTELHFVVPMISEKRAEQFNQLKQRIAPNLPVTIITNKTQQVMAASDCLLMASGTVTLEAALVKRPMVICYKFNAFTYHMFKGLVKLKWFSLPNLLSNKSLVPELLQGKVTVGNIVPLVTERLYQDQSSLEDEYMNIHLALKQDASQEAAKAVIGLMSK